MKRWVSVIAVGLVIVLAVGGVVVLEDSDGPTAVQLGSTKISQASVDDELQALADNTALQKSVAQQGQQGSQISRSHGSVTADLSAGWLGLLVGTTAAQHEVERRKLKTTDADMTQGKSLAVQSVGGSKVFSTLPEWFQDRLEQRWTAVATLQREVLANPTPALLDAAGAQCPSGRYVSHILVSTQAEAQAVKRSLDAGGDFAKLAKANSIDGSAKDGGQLGCLDGSHFVEPFATTAATQPIGVPSDPIQTEFGYHVVLVTDKPSASVLEQASIDEILGRSRGKRVHVDPRYGTWDRRTGQVLPPAVPGAVAPAPSG